MTKLSSGAVLAIVLSSNEFKNVVAERMATGALYHPDNKTPLDKNSKEYLAGLKDAMNPKLWKRCEKLKLEITDYPGNTEGLFSEIGIWDDGEIDYVLKEKALQDWINSGKNKKALPIQRGFVMSKYMGGDYMMNVWTTHDDTQLIGWAVNSD